MGAYPTPLTLRFSLSLFDQLGDFDRTVLRDCSNCARMNSQMRYHNPTGAAMDPCIGCSARSNYKLVSHH